MLDDLKHHSKTVGIKQTLKAVETDRVRAVYIAKDAEERLVGRVIEVCREKGIQIYRAETMKALGKACGIDVGTSVAAIMND